MLGSQGPLDKTLIEAWMNLDWQRLYPGLAQQPVRDELMQHLSAMLAAPLPAVPLDGALVDVAPALLAMDRIRTGTVSYVETMTGRKASYARDQVAARSASDDERGALGLTDQNAAVLAYRHTVFDSNDAPLEFAEAVYPPDRWTFEQEYSVET